MINWIQAKVISSGKTVQVRQGDPGGAVFIDSDNEVYTLQDLDFNGVQDTSEESENEVVVERVELDPDAAKGFFGSFLKNNMQRETDKNQQMEVQFWRDLRVRLFMGALKDLNEEDISDCLELADLAVRKLCEYDIRFKNRYFKKP